MAITDPVLSEHVEWMRHRRLSEETVRLRKVVLGLVGDVCRKPLLACTEADLQVWEHALAVGDSSRATYTAQVHAFYTWATATKRLTCNPSAELVPPRLPRRQPRPISEPDLALALTTAPSRVAPWLELAAFAGFRAAEVARLERADVHDELPDPVLLVQGKGRRERVVPMAPRVWDALLVHGLPRTGWVFPRLDGEPGPMTPGLVSKLASEHLRSLGIDGTLHALRHFYGTELYRASGNDIRLTQDLLGHASPVTTSVYAGWSNRKAFDSVLAFSQKNRRTA